MSIVRQLKTLQNIYSYVINGYCTDIGEYYPMLGCHRVRANSYFSYILFSLVVCLFTERSRQILHINRSKIVCSKVVSSVFSSSELCSGWAIVITFHPSVRPSVHPLTFSNDFSEAPEPILLKFHMEPP